MFSNDNRLSRLVEEAILEDLATGDVTTEAIVPPDLPGRAEIMIKSPGIVAGLSVAEMVFQCVDFQVSFEKLCADGFFAKPGTTIARAEGFFSSLLKSERTALNILQRMSGIATLTSQFVGAVKGSSAKITDTRKTPPGLRILDKLAVRTGGGVNHRFGLDDMILVKNNHIAAAGGIRPALERCLPYARSRNLPVEVETTNLDDIREVLQFPGVNRIMLDNFSLDAMREAVLLVKHSAEVEASGGISLENVRAVAETGVDFISVGLLTHSPPALDMSMKISQR